MSDIRVLPVHLVNKIAAGEVIERPASVVKELVENALDAGARRIDLTCEDGGKSLIAVRDDGGGMDAEDLALAFCPHATSKLGGEEDLFAIRTMGFRGEALASIASISHAHIRTARAEGESGFELAAAGETVEEVRPCASATGTTVTVRDLFFNTPARRKFMRTASTEIGHVTEQLARLAIPHPRVAFTLTHNGREMHNLPATESTSGRVSDLFGSDLGEALLPIRRREGEVGIAGLIARPDAARSSAKWQYFFLNGRYIRDRLLAHALREAFRGLIDPRQYPVAFVFIDLPPDEVDVNVHPTKVEVRFANGNRIHSQLLASLRETLNAANLTPSALLDGGQDADAPTGGHPRSESLKTAIGDFFKSQPAPAPHLDYTRRAGTAPAARPPAATGRGAGEPQTAPHPPWHAPSAPAGLGGPPAGPAYPPGGAEGVQPGQPGPYAQPGMVSQVPPAGDAGPSLAPPLPGPGRPFLQLHDSYLVTECEDGIELIDQHALHERILYNEFRRRLAEGGLAGQGMLIPATLAVTASEADLLSEQAELLGRLGIAVEPFGPATIAIQRFPAMLIQRRIQPAEFVRSLLDALAEDEPSGEEQLLEHMLATMACKAAVKAGDPLSDEEIANLLAAREGLDKATACPHGRPTAIKLTLKDLARQFHRT